MTLDVGVIGLGVMGADHARNLAFHTPGARLAAVCDADAARAAAMAQETGARVVAGGPLALVQDSGVDAVVVVSPDATHRELVLACLAARKPVLCEKPLAPTEEECLEIVQAEVALGRRLVQVGYNRRFDPWYLDLKAQLDSGELGRPMMMHCQHRNVSAPSWFTASMAITNSAVHDFDIARWLLSGEFTSVQAFVPASPDGEVPGAPVFLVLETARGQLIDIEVFINAQYGYDVVAEVVCEKGALALGANSYTHRKSGLAQGSAYPLDWRPRFADSYRAQMQAWVQSIRDGQPCGASAWDGYLAAHIAAAALGGLRTRWRVTIETAARPALYGPDPAHT